MVEFTDEQKKDIFDRMADEHTSPVLLAKEFECKLADIMDAVVDVISSRGETKTYIPVTSLEDGDDMTEPTKQTRTEKKPVGKKPKTCKWSEVLGVTPAKQKETKKEDKRVSINDVLDGVGGFKIEKIDLDNHPELKQAAADFIDALADETNKREEAKCCCNCAKQHEPILVDRLGALAYRLSKLHMSEEMIIKVLNITLGVPEPTIREALK